MANHNDILRELKRLAHRLFSGLPAKVYLYGSRARGEANDDSDWDLLIVTDDSISSNDDFEKFVYPFTEMGWRLEQQVTPLLYTRSQWDAEKNTAFYLNVTKDAIPL